MWVAVEWSPTRLSEATVACHHFAASSFRYSRRSYSKRPRNDLYRYWHFPVRIERRFYYGILADERTAKSYNGALGIESSSVQFSRKTPERGSIIERFVSFFSLLLHSKGYAPGETASRRRFQRIDCFSYGGENTLYINERPGATEDKINDPQVFMAVTCRDRLNKCLFLASARPRLVSFTRRKGIR